MKRFPWLLSISAGACVAAGLLIWFLTAARALPFHPAAGLKSCPPVMLWAWERPEALQFIDPQKEGAAFFSRRIVLHGSKVSVVPRYQMLRVPDGTYLMAVVRIETDTGSPPPLDAAQLSRVMRCLKDVAAMPWVKALQIDFDAKESERPFYRRLLLCLRKELPRSTGLSITALASWCVGDYWIEDLPVDEVVPMMFATGPEGKSIQEYLAHGGTFRTEPGRTAVGVSIDEFDLGRATLSGRKRLLLPPARVYLFSRRPWTRTSFSTAIEELEKWR